MCLKYRACAENLASRNSSADLPETGPAEQNRPYVPRAGGQDDGSLPKLPQIIIIFLYHHIMNDYIIVLFYPIII